MSKKVLIIEDETRYAQMVTMRLKNAGFEVIYAADGKEGIELAQKEKPDLILCDVLMPGINGYEVVRQLKADPATNPIPVVMLTVLEDPESINLAYGAGAADYVPKMYEGSLLVEKVKKILEVS